jgi:hypothetical protein
VRGPRPRTRRLPRIRLPERADRQGPLPRAPNLAEAQPPARRRAHDRPAARLARPARRLPLPPPRRLAADLHPRRLSARGASPRQRRRTTGSRTSSFAVAGTTREAAGCTSGSRARCQASRCGRETVAPVEQNPDFYSAAAAVIPFLLVATVLEERLRPKADPLALYRFLAFLGAILFVLGEALALGSLADRHYTQTRETIISVVLAVGLMLVVLAMLLHHGHGAAPEKDCSRGSMRNAVMALAGLFRSPWQSA